MKKRMISAMLAMAMLFMFTACRPDAEDTVISADTSGTQSDVTTTPDATSSAEDTSSEEDISSLEYTSQPKEPVEDTPDEPAEDEEEPSPTFDETTLEALSNPGAILDYDVFLVDTPEEGSEWKLLRYNIEEEKLYEELTFDPQTANGKYKVEFAEEYIGNILRVSFEDEDTEFYIDVEKSKFYNASEFKGTSKTVSVTKRSIGVTKNGQYEYWGTSHPDYGKVYYSELNADENLLLTVFLKNNKYTFTAYNYETKELKNLFTLTEKPEVKLLNDGWFIFELQKPTETDDGRLYMCNVDEGVRRQITTKGKRITKSINNSVEVIPAMIQSLMDEAKKGNALMTGGALIWTGPHERVENSGYVYSFQTKDGSFDRSIHASLRKKNENAFFKAGPYVGVKLYDLSQEYDCDIHDDLATGKIYVYGHSGRSLNCVVPINKSVCEYYYTADGKHYLYKVKDETAEEWHGQTAYSEYDADWKTVIRNKNVLNNPGVTIGDELWIVDSIDSENDENDKLKLFRYNLVSRKMYIEAEGNINYYNYGNCEVVLRTLSNGKEYIEVRTYDEYGEDYEGFFYDYIEGRIVESEEIWGNSGDEGDTIISTDLEDPVIGNESFEVPATHPEYGKFVYGTAILIPGQNKAVIAYDTDYEGHSTVVVYDYDTNKFKKLLYVDEYIVGLKYVDDGYVLIATCPYFDGEGWYVNQTVYTYNIATGVLKKIPADLSDGRSIFYSANNIFRNKTVWWSSFDFGNNEDDVRVGTQKYYVYDIEKNKKYELLTLETLNFDFSIYPGDRSFYAGNGMVVKANRTEAMVSLVGPLYYCTTKKTTCISEKALYFYVCEDQGYVMYYEEQADGSFEWKYYDL